LRTVVREHIAAHFEPFGLGSAVTGFSPAEMHNRDPRKLPLPVEGAALVGNGAPGAADDGTLDVPDEWDDPYRFFRW